MNLTPAAWDAIGHDQTHWSAVRKALAAAAPHYNHGGALQVASILEDYGNSAAAAAVREVVALQRGMRAPETPTEPTPTERAAAADEISRWGQANPTCGCLGDWDCPVHDNCRACECGCRREDVAAWTARLKPYTTSDPEIRGGEPCITGTRIPVEEVAAMLADGVPLDGLDAFWTGMSARLSGLSPVRAATDPNHNEETP